MDHSRLTPVLPIERKPDGTIINGHHRALVTGLIPGAKQGKKPKAEKPELSDTEIRILQSLHLQGHMGKCGSLSRKDRKAILLKLINSGHLSEHCNLTQKGIDASAPKYL